MQVQIPYSEKLYNIEYKEANVLAKYPKWYLPIAMFLDMMYGWKKVPLFGHTCPR